MEKIDCEINFGRFTAIQFKIVQNNIAIEFCKLIKNQTFDEIWEIIDDPIKYRIMNEVIIKIYEKIK